MLELTSIEIVKLAFETSYPIIVKISVTILVVSFAKQALEYLHSI